MCQVLGGELSLVDPCVDLCVDVVEGTFEWSVNVAQSGKRSSQAWTQDAIIGPSEEERCAEAELGYAVAEAIGEAFDKAVQAKATKLIGNGALGKRLWIAAGHGGKVVAQIGAAEALCELTE